MSAAYPRAQRVVTCAATRCREPVRRGDLMCRAHWLSLPSALRRSILVTFRHRIVDDYQALVSKAVDLVDARFAEGWRETFTGADADGRRAVWAGRRF